MALVNSTPRVDLRNRVAFCINQCKPKSRNETVLVLGYSCPGAELVRGIK
jgi:hypothetical protein